MGVRWDSLDAFSERSVFFSKTHRAAGSSRMFKHIGRIYGEFVEILKNWTHSLTHHYGR